MPNPEPKSLASASSAKSPSFRPVQDEWGVYDPAQAGLEAVIRKLASLREDDAKPNTKPEGPILPGN